MRADIKDSDFLHIKRATTNTFREVDLKTLQILFIILLFVSPLCADEGLILSKIEQLQEKIWLLQKAVAEQNTSIAKQQTQLGLVVSNTERGQLELSDHLAALTQSIARLQDEAIQVETELENLGEALATLTSEVRQNHGAGLEQAQRIGTLEGSLQALRAELATKQKSAKLEVAEIRAQLIETRSSLHSMGQDVGGRIEQIGLWGAGAALVLVIVLTFIMAGRRNKSKGRSHDRKQSSEHEL